MDFDIRANPACSRAGVQEARGYNNSRGVWHKAGWGGRYMRNTHTIPRPDVQADAFPGGCEELRGRELYITTGHNIYTVPTKTHVHEHTHSEGFPQTHKHTTRISRTVGTGDLQVIYNTNAQYQELTDSLNRIGRTASVLRAKSLHHKSMQYGDVLIDDPTSIHLRQKVNESSEQQMRHWSHSLYAFGLPRECPTCDKKRGANDQRPKSAEPTTYRI
mmetsp:Transcript_5602/g.7575  ORF Transcript_5602/g.7575 Transcript_5602/m.7575 type:complete len:217 (+) Transcript_5602:65-715(+)